jgi:hypothetical protein
MPSYAVVAFLAGCLFEIHAQSIRSEVNGRVIDEDGSGISGALVVASGAGFYGWANTDADGSFHLKAAGAFISVRHQLFKAQLIRLSELPEPVRISLMKSDDETTWKLPACNSLPNRGMAWIGGGLRVISRSDHFTGPVYGEHDSHWYIKSGNGTLHIVDGYAWHSGLPLESTLTASQGINVRSWIYKEIVGLDLSGQTKDGKRWRWIGAPVAYAIEYRNATPESADHFDKIIESACFGSI